MRRSIERVWILNLRHLRPQSHHGIEWCRRPKTAICQLEIAVSNTDTTSAYAAYVEKSSFVLAHSAALACISVMKVFGLAGWFDAGPSQNRTRALEGHENGFH